MLIWSGKCRRFIILGPFLVVGWPKKLSCIESDIPSDCGRTVWRQCALVGRVEGQLKWRRRAVMCRRECVCVYASGYNITYLSLSLWLSLQLSELNRDLFFPSRKKKKTLSFLSDGFILSRLKPFAKWFNCESNTVRVNPATLTGRFSFLSFFLIYAAAFAIFAEEVIAVCGPCVNRLCSPWPLWRIRWVWTTITTITTLSEVNIRWPPVCSRSSGLWTPNTGWRCTRYQTPPAQSPEVSPGSLNRCLTGVICLCALGYHRSAASKLYFNWKKGSYSMWYAKILNWQVVYSLGFWIMLFDRALFA